MLGILKFLPPRVAVVTFYIFTIIFYIFRYLAQTTSGVLILSISAYLLLNHYSLSKPFTAGELLSWLSQQSQEAKVAVATSLLTVTGFIVAFDSATRSWKDQLQAQLKAQAAGELEVFFGAVLKLIGDSDIYVKNLVEAYDAVLNKEPADRVLNSINWAVSGNEKFFAARQQLSQALVEIHGLRGRHYTILSAGFGLASTFDRAANGFSKIGDAMWFTIPMVNPQNDNPIDQFMKFSEIDKYRIYLAKIEKYGAPIAMYAAAIKGQIFAPIIGQNFSTIIDLVKNKRIFMESLTKLHENMNEKE